MPIEGPQTEEEQCGSELAIKSTTNKQKRKYTKKDDKKSDKTVQQDETQSTAELQGWYAVKSEETAALENRFAIQSYNHGPKNSPLKYLEPTE